MKNHAKNKINNFKKHVSHKNQTDKPQTNIKWAKSKKVSFNSC
jgi:hypothetical protein